LWGIVTVSITIGEKAMRITRYTCGVLATVGILLILPSFAGPRKPESKGIPWLRSMVQAKKRAAKMGKPILADYYAEWCPPCKEMLATTYKDKVVIERAKRFVPVLIDIDKDEKDANAAGIEAVPTVVFCNSKGKEILRSTGYHDAKTFLALMAEAEKKAKNR